MPELIDSNSVLSVFIESHVFTSSRYDLHNLTLDVEFKANEFDGVTEIWYLDWQMLMLADVREVHDYMAFTHDAHVRRYRGMFTALAEPAHTEIECCRNLWKAVALATAAQLMHIEVELRQSPHDVDITPPTGPMAQPEQRQQQIGSGPGLLT